jgi:hypothetical protein
MIYGSVCPALAIWAEHAGAAGGWHGGGLDVGVADGELFQVCGEVLGGAGVQVAGRLLGLWVVGPEDDFRACVSLVCPIPVAPTRSADCASVGGLVIAESAPSVPP